LCSRAFLETPSNEKPHLKLTWLEGMTDGLIVLTGGPGGPLDAAIMAGQSDLAAMRCATLQKLFGDRLYMELQRHGTPGERVTEGPLIELAYARHIPLVATNEPYFAKREDYDAHDALIAIAERRVAAYGLAPGRTIEEYRERLALELQVIEGMKYPGYFLIVSDFIQWAKDQGIPVGPGRGSGAGSLVSYALTITDLDPLRFNL